jgi:hypothetical protein
MFFTVFLVLVSKSTASANNGGRGDPKDMSGASTSNHDDHADGLWRTPRSPQGSATPTLTKGNPFQPVPIKESRAAQQLTGESESKSGDVTAASARGVDWSLVANWVSAIFTGIAAIAAGKAATVAAGANKIARETAKRELRAYVSVSATCVRGDLKNMGRVYFEFVNSGQTPAYVITVRSVLEIRRTSDDRPFLAGNPGSYGSLGPGEKQHSWKQMVRPLTPSEVLAIESGELTIFCHGGITYQDAFGETHTTAFRREVFDFSDSASLSISQEGNEAN